MFKQPQPEARKVIVVEPQLKWGKVLCKPLCDQAKQFCALFGNENLSIENLQKIINLGYDIDERQPSLIRPHLKNIGQNTNNPAR